MYHVLVVYFLNHLGQNGVQDGLWMNDEVPHVEEA